MDFLKIARQRQSCRSYDKERAVEREKLDKILEAARLAPSACNGQPYRITVCGTDTARAVAGATQGMGMNKFASDAPVMIVISEMPYCATAAVGAKVKKNDYRSIDIGILAAYITAEAETLGLASCILGWLDDGKIRRICSLDGTVRLVIALGYAKREDKLREKKRKEGEELFSLVDVANDSKALETEIIRAPFDASEVLDLIEQSFGKGERALEGVQLDGSESEFNDDVVFIARENGVMLGTLHITIPRSNPSLCGVSGVVTTKAARGKGVGGRLFAQAMDYIDSVGVKTAFLGTGNPIAAKMYEKNGFRYIYGTGVMLRCRDGSEVDFYKDYTEAPSGEFDVIEGTPSLRISLIPLAVHKGASVIYDINTNIVNSGYITQGSCMSLYPRYLRLAQEGGAYYFAEDSRGVIGAVMSLKPIGEENRVDFFSFDSFSSAIPKMLSKVSEKYGNIFFEAAKTDGKKADMIRSLGYCREEASSYSINGFEVPTVRFYK